MCAYVSIGLMNCLQTCVMCSWECPYLVCVSARRTFSLLFALVLMLSVCCLNVSMGSSVTPRIVQLGLTRMGVL